MTSTPKSTVALIVLTGRQLVSLSLTAVVVEGCRYKGSIVAAGANVPSFQNGKFS